MKITRDYLVLFSWLERRFVNLTFIDDEIDCDVDEIRAMLDEPRDN
jgi:hypothetical protein